MKRTGALVAVIVAFVFCLTFTCLAWATHEKAAADTEKTEKAEKVEKKKEQSICPVTKMEDNDTCMKCHVVVMRDGKAKWALKEVDPNAEFDYPGPSFKFDGVGDQRVGRLLLSNIDALKVEESLNYAKRHGVKKVIIELHNPGGSMFGMWRIVGLMDSFKEAGGVIETQCQGFSASASFIVFTNGTKGHRFVAPESLHMWHEAMSFSMFDLKTASSTEEEAKIMRKFQNTAHTWLAKRSLMPKEKLDQMVSKKELWLTGAEMVEYGFADGFIK